MLKFQIKNLSKCRYILMKFKYDLRFKKNICLILNNKLFNNCNTNYISFDSQ
jgi:hypothetical protein